MDKNKRPDHPFDNQIPIDLLQENAGIGWWYLNHTAHTLRLSSYAARMLGIKPEEVPSAEFVQAIHPDMRTSILSRIDNMMLGDFDFYEDKTLIRTVEGYRWARLKVARTGLDGNADRYFEGFIQFIEEEKQTVPDAATRQLNRLLDWQHSLTKNLLGLLGGGDNNAVIQNLLRDILGNFKGSYAMILAFDRTHNTYNCLYESTCDGLPARIEKMQNLPIREDAPWYRELAGKSPVFVNDLNEITAYQGLRDELGENIGAFMAAPLISQEEVWGVLRIDVMDQSRIWSHVDRESFLAVVNVVGVSLALSRSEEQARFSARNLESLYRNMPMGYFRLRVKFDEQGEVVNYDYIDVNNKFADMMRRPRHDLIGKTLEEVGQIYKEKLPLDILRDVALNGATHQTRGQFLSDGRHYNTLLYSPEQGDVVALFNDITALQEVTDALARSEEELKKIYMNIPLGIELYDSQGIMIDVNDQEVAIQGVANREALLGLSLFDHPSLPQHAYELLKEGKDVTFDVDDISINHHYYGVEMHNGAKYLTIKCNVLHNHAGEVENFLLIVIDNTQMFETSARLREFEADFNSVAQFAEVGFFRWNLARGIYTNTDQWFRNMGLERGRDAAGALASYSHVIHPDDLTTLEGFISAVIEGRAESLKHEFRVRDGHGWKWLRTMCHVTKRDLERDILEVVGINDNINELKITEARLIEARHRAEESDRLKSAFLANMSHEIRTPLNAIVGFSSIILDASSDEERREYLGIIQKNNEHLLHLISDILDLSKIESGMMEIQITEINAADLCRQVTTSLSLKAQGGVDVRFVTEGRDRVSIPSDLKRLTQVLSNFVVNATKFTSKGHIDIGFDLRPEEIEFWVEDTGIGMTDEQVAHVFERFVKHNEFIPGTGLGLSICQSIIEQLGGKIGATSQPGVGSRFWFSLPLRPVDRYA